jgi:hypothetical protein
MSQGILKYFAVVSWEEHLKNVAAENLKSTELAAEREERQRIRDIEKAQRKRELARLRKQRQRARQGQKVQPFFHDSGMLWTFIAEIYRNKL